MAYTLGDTIAATEYNGFANQVNAINATNYGQSAISTLSIGTVISAAQWATLLNDISKASDHQASTITAISNPVATDPIAILAALTANITVIENNTTSAAANGTAITAGGSIDRTTAWNKLVTMPITVTFDSVSEMDIFFAAGGRVTIAFSRSGGTPDEKNDGWTALCTACGTINITGEGATKTIAGTAYTGTTKIGGSGTPDTLLTATGASDLITTDTLIFKQFDASTDYTANYITLNAKINAAVLTLTIVYTDDANTSLDEIVDGTLNTTVTAAPPSTTYITNQWGTQTLGGSESGSSNSTVTSGSFVVGIWYTIVTTGTTNFVTEQSAADSNPGTIFQAIAAGTGTGTADVTIERLSDAVDMTSGVTYQVVTVGTSDFTQAGASSNAVDEVFTTTGDLITAGSFVVGKEYTVSVVGTTNFVAIGAPVNWAGAQFFATGVGSGTGTATETGSITGTGTVRVT